ncbi:MAG: isoprenyl transferase [Rhodospirillales bacterium]|nr:isoprenyl transferase [Rhodospirillales bacterium]
MNVVPLATAFPPPTPVHVAIIMDGNGRWARARGLPRTAGHRRGADAARIAVETAGRMGIQYLTLFAFSSENWKRPEAEISDLMGLLRHYLRNEIDRFHQSGVRLRVIGNRSRLSPDIVKLIAAGEERTAGNEKMTLIIALNYGGRAEVAAAARDLAKKVAAGELAADDIGEALIADHLDTAGIPDPDLLIRTSGEQRISNFLIWQLAYTELVFLDLLWPDFTRKEFEAAIREYESRHRRYGAVQDPVPVS